MIWSVRLTSAGLENVMTLNNPMDIGIGIFIGMFCIMGFAKGAKTQFFNILAFVLASAAGLAVPHFVDLPNFESVSPIWSYVIFSLLIWIPSFLILNSIGKFIAKRMSRKGISFTDRVWGFAFGGIKGLIIVILIIFLVNILPIEPAIFQESRIVDIVKPYNPLLKIQLMRNLEIIISALGDPDYMDLLSRDNGFQRLRNNPAIRSILDDPELKKAISQRQFLMFITHPKVQEIIKDKEAVGLLLTTDIDKTVINNI